MKKRICAALCLTLMLCCALQVIAPASVGIVFQAQAAAKVKLNYKKAKLYSGETLQLEVLGTTDKVTWSTSDKTVATVNKKGLVTSKKTGKATITADVNNKKYTCKLTVKNSMSVYPKKLTLDVGKKEIITVDLKTDIREYLYFKVSDKSIIRAKWIGIYKGSLEIEALKPGQATIEIMNKKTSDVVTVDVMVKTPPTVTINLPVLPMKIGMYYGERLMIEYTITDVAYESEPSWDGKCNVTLKVAGIKTYDYEGAASSDWASIGYKLYDGKGNVVDGGLILGPSVSVGDSWSLSSCEKYFYSLNPGVYSLALHNLVY